MAEVAVGDRLQADHENMYRETSDGKVYRRVSLGGSISIPGLGGLLAGVTYDYVKATYPNPTTEIYQFKNGGAGGTLETTITITYTDATKELIDEVVGT
jgi:hypothetical protein